jgi:hypothetical protein
VLTGRVWALASAGDAEPLADALLEAFRSLKTREPVAKTSTDRAGDYSLDVPTAMMPWGGFLRLSATGRIPFVIFPAHPLTRNGTFETPPLYGQAIWELLQTFGGVVQDPGKGAVLVGVRDCAGRPVSGAVIGISTPGQVLYADSGSPAVPSTSQTATSDNGLAFAFNVPAGEVGVRVSASSRADDVRTVTAFPGEITFLPAEP